MHIIVARYYNTSRIVCTKTIFMGRRKDGGFHRERKMVTSPKKSSSLPPKRWWESPLNDRIKPGWYHLKNTIR